MIKEEKPVTKLLIENAKQILTMQGESNHDVGMLEGGSIYIEGNLIKAIGLPEHCFCTYCWSGKE